MAEPDRYLFIQHARWEIKEDFGPVRKKLRAKGQVLSTDNTIASHAADLFFGLTEGR